jgi:hypothetical protein
VNAPKAQNIFRLPLLIAVQKIWTQWGAIFIRSLSIPFRKYWLPLAMNFRILKSSITIGRV